MAYAMNRLTNVQYRNSVRDLLGGLTFEDPDLPTENVTDGFRNVASGQTTTALGVESYANAAEKLAAVVKLNTKQVFGCSPTNTGDETTCVASFLGAFSKRAFRRPLDDEEKKRFLAFFQAQRSMSSSDFPTAASTLVQLLLQAPAFLYRIETGAGAPAADGSVHLTPYEVATRLAYFLTDGPPDAPLMQAADDGNLKTADDVKVQAQRLLATDRARLVVTSFHSQWLRLSKISDATKDGKTFSSFSSDVASALAKSTAGFLDYTFWQQNSLKAMLTDSHGFVNDQLAPYFGVPAPGSKDLKMVSLDPTQRAGVLTQPGLLTGLAGPLHDSPVQRGVLVLDSFLCRRLAPPPKGVNTNPPAFDPSKPTTTRQRIETQHAVADCAGCHVSIDGIGFAFEAFDAVGAWRTAEAGMSVDSSAELVGTDVDGPLNGAVALTGRLAESRQVADCVAYTWMRFALGLDRSQMNMSAVSPVADQFWASGGRFTDLLFAIATSDAFLSVKVSN
jgi:hypothetical protein